MFIKHLSLVIRDLQATVHVHHQTELNMSTSWEYFQIKTNTIPGAILKPTLLAIPEGVPKPLGHLMLLDTIIRCPVRSSAAY